MADTVRGWFPYTKCTDCFQEGVSFKHWGPIVPPQIRGEFCDGCWDIRHHYYETNGKPLPVFTPETLFVSDGKELKGKLMKLGHSFSQAVAEKQEELAFSIIREARELRFLAMGIQLFLVS
jgi:hypothetical protein